MTIPSDAECRAIMCKAIGYECTLAPGDAALIRAAYAAGAARAVPRAAHPCGDCGADDWIPGDYQCANCGSWVAELPDAALGESTERGEG